MSDWKDKRISAINRIIKKTGGSTIDWLDEYDSICLSKAKNKMEYKLERKHEKNNMPTICRDFPE